MPLDDRAFSELSWLAQARRSFWEFLADYHWATKVFTSILVVLAFVGTAGAFLGAPLTQHFAGLTEGSSAVRLETALTSDPFLTFMALAVAFLVGVSIKSRQLAGLLDDSEHYDVGRALAFGYFKNFLVGALLAAQEQKTKLHVFKPANVEQLREFENNIWPLLEPEKRTRTIEVTGLMLVDKKPLKRRILVIDQMNGQQGPLFFDFPTTLFTVADYYDSWNRWHRTEGTTPIPVERLPVMQQTQITAFFDHIKRLAHEEVGLQAVSEFGLTGEHLRSLYDSHLELISLDELRRMLVPVTT